MVTRIIDPDCGQLWWSATAFKIVPRVFTWWAQLGSNQ
jgi:hypothetical protein